MLLDAGLPLETICQAFPIEKVWKVLANSPSSHQQARLSDMESFLHRLVSSASPELIKLLAPSHSQQISTSTQLSVPPLHTPLPTPSTSYPPAHSGQPASAIHQAQNAAQVGPGSANATLSKFSELVNSLPHQVAVQLVAQLSSNLQGSTSSQTLNANIPTSLPLSNEHASAMTVSQLSALLQLQQLQQLQHALTSNTAGSLSSLQETMGTAQPSNSTNHQQSSHQQSNHRLSGDRNSTRPPFSHSGRENMSSVTSDGTHSNDPLLSTAQGNRSTLQLTYGAHNTSGMNGQAYGVTSLALLPPNSSSQHHVYPPPQRSFPLEASVLRKDRGAYEKSTAQSKSRTPSREHTLASKPSMLSKEPYFKAKLPISSKQESPVHAVTDFVEPMSLEVSDRYNLVDLPGTWNTIVAEHRPATPPRLTSLESTPKKYIASSSLSYHNSIPTGSNSQRLHPLRQSQSQCMSTTTIDSHMNGSNDSSDIAESASSSSNLSKQQRRKQNKKFGPNISKPLVFDLSTDDETDRTTKANFNGRYGTDSDTHTALERARLLVQLKVRENETRKMKSKIALMEANAKKAKRSDKDEEDGNVSTSPAPDLSNARSDTQLTASNSVNRNENGIQIMTKDSEMSLKDRQLPQSQSELESQQLDVTETLSQLFELEKSILMVSAENDARTEEISTLKADIHAVEEIIRLNQEKLPTLTNSLTERNHTHVAGLKKLVSLRLNESKLQKQIKRQDQLANQLSNGNALREARQHALISPPSDSQAAILAEQFLSSLPPTSTPTTVIASDVQLQPVPEIKEENNLENPMPERVSITAVNSSFQEDTESSSIRKRPIASGSDNEQVKRVKYDAQELAKLMHKLDTLQKQQKVLKTLRINPLAQKAIDYLTALPNDLPSLINTTTKAYENNSTSTEKQLFEDDRSDASIDILHLVEYHSGGISQFMNATTTALCLPSQLSATAERHNWTLDHATLITECATFARARNTGTATETTTTTSKSNSRRQPQIAAQLPHNIFQYQSPLGMFRSFRFSPRVLDEKVSSRHLATAKTDIQLCIYELQGGYCRNTACADVHLDQLGKTDEELAMELLSFEDGVPQDKLSEYRTSLIKQLELISLTTSTEKVLQTISKHRYEWFGKIWVPSGRKIFTSSVDQSSIENTSDTTDLLSSLSSTDREQCRLPRNVPVSLRGFQNLLDGRAKTGRYWEASRGLDECEADVKREPLNEMLWLKYAIECMPEYLTPGMLSSSLRLNKPLAVLATGLEALPESFQLWNLYLELSMRRGTEDNVRADFTTCRSHIGEVDIIRWKELYWEPDRQRRQALYNDWLEYLLCPSTVAKRDIIADVFVNKLYDAHSVATAKRTANMLWRFLTIDRTTDAAVIMSFVEDTNNETELDEVQLQQLKFPRSRSAAFLSVSHLWRLWTLYFHLLQYSDLPPRAIFFRDFPHHHLVRPRQYLVRWPKGTRPIAFSLSDMLRKQWLQRYALETQERRVCFAALVQNHVNVLIAMDMPLIQVMKALTAYQARYPTNVEFCHMHLRALSELNDPSFAQARDACLIRFPDDMALWNIAISHELKLGDPASMLGVVVRCGSSSFQTSIQTVDVPDTQSLQDTINIMCFRVGVSYTQPSHPEELRAHIRAGCESNCIFTWLNLSLIWLLEPCLTNCEPRLGLLYLLDQGSYTSMGTFDRMMLLSELIGLLVRRKAPNSTIRSLLVDGIDRFVLGEPYPAVERCDISFMDIVPITDVDLVVDMFEQVQTYFDPTMLRVAWDAVARYARISSRLLLLYSSILSKNTIADRTQERSILEQALLLNPDNEQAWQQLLQVEQPMEQRSWLEECFRRHLVVIKTLKC